MNENIEKTDKTIADLERDIKNDLYKFRLSEHHYNDLIRKKHNEYLNLSEEDKNTYNEDGVILGEVLIQEANLLIRIRDSMGAEKTLKQLAMYATIKKNSVEVTSGGFNQPVLIDIKTIPKSIIDVAT